MIKLSKPISTPGARVCIKAGAEMTLALPIFLKVNVAAINQG